MAGAQAVGVLDDALRAAGVEPHPEPDPGDRRQVAATAALVGTLLARTQATARTHDDLADALAPVETLLRAQRAAVGGRGQPPAPQIPARRVAAARELRRDLEEAARRCGDEAVGAVSTDLSQVLAAMSGGLVQAARVVDAAAGARA